MGLFGPTGGGGGAVTSVNSQTGVVNLTAQDVTATPLYYTYKQHSATFTGSPPTWTMPVANVAGFYNDIRLQGNFSSSTTIEIRIPRITPNEELVFGYECLFCCELADRLALGQQFPTIVVRDNGDNSVIFSRPGGANPNISFSIYLRKEFATGWEVIPFPADVQGKEDKNISNGYAGLNFSGKIALEQLDATITGAASATLPNPQVVLGSDPRLKSFVAIRPTNWFRNASGNVTISVPSSTNFAVGDVVTITGSARTSGTGANIDGTFAVTSVGGIPVIAINFSQPGEPSAQGTSGILVRQGIVGTPVLKTDWNAASGQPDEILNKPTIPAAQVNANWSATSGVAEILNKPTIPAAPVNADWNSTSGLSQILNKPNIPSKVAFGPMIILRFANWGRGQTGYGPGNPPTGMSTLTPTSGNVVENFNPDIYHPRLFNGGQFFGVGRQYKLICAVRCDQIAFDGVHCQLRYFNGTTSQIIAGLMDFGGGNDGIAIKSYFATSDTLTAVDEWWSFVPYFGAFNGSNFARIQDCVVVAYLV
jgi:hypothetical protein